MKHKLRQPAKIEAKHIRDRAREFAKWLEADEEPQDLFRPLVDLAMAHTKYERENPRGLTLEPSDPFNLYKTKIDRILGRIQKRYPCQLKLVDWGDKSGKPFYARQPVRWTRREAWEACVMLDAFELLANAGAFAVFKRCALPACSKCFFALRLHRRYCSDACQRTHYDESPKRTDANRKYQKRHYREYLSAEAKRMQKLAARRGLSPRLPLSALKKRLGKA
jgi:hypothetical protein